ncbi:MAG: YncE family protein [Acidobacteriota bacterium]
MKNKLPFIALAVVFFLGVSAIAQNDSGYHLVDTIKVGGDGGWDALTVDSNAHRLYVSHGTHVAVIDTVTDKVVGDIPNTNGVHGIAIAPKFGKGFTSNGRDNTVTVFDLTTLKAVGTIKAGKNPDIIIYDPASKRVFCFNAGSNDATVIDPEKGTVVGTVNFDGNPEFAVSDNKGTIFVNIESKSEIESFDAKTLAVKSHFPLAPCEEPTGIAIDVKNGLIFSACANKRMIVTDAKTGKVVGDIPTGQGTDGAAFDPETRFAFSSNGEGTLTVIGGDAKDKFNVVENVKTHVRARTMAIDPKTHKVYLPAAEFGTAPAPTKEQPRPRAPIVPDSFMVLVYGR